MRRLLKNRHVFREGKALFGGGTFLVASSLYFGEDGFADANGFWGDFNEFVGGDPFEGGV